MNLPLYPIGVLGDKVIVHVDGKEFVDGPVISTMAELTIGETKELISRFQESLRIL